MIVIIDYGVGNLFSLTSSLRAIGAEVCVSSDPDVIQNADKLILPGVGAFSDAAAKLRESGLAELIKTHYPEAEVLMGTSTAGIAHAAITAHLMGLPMGYVRSGAKDHGRQNQIEGKLEAGQKVVVVEDLISTGGSVIEVVNVLREAGAEVLGIVSIFTYGMKKGLVRLEEANVKNVSLTNFDVIAEIAAEENYIKKEDVARLIAFRNNPSDESWIGA